MASTSENNPVKRTGWGTVILGGLAAVYAVTAFFSTAFGGEVEVKEIEGFKTMMIYLQDFLVCLAAIVAVFGGIIAWWNRLPRAIMLILAEIIMIVLSFLPISFRTPITQNEASSGVLGVPFLVAGALILYARWRSKKSTQKNTNA